MAKNFFFRAYNLNSDDTYARVHINTEDEIWQTICQKYLDTPEYAQQAHKDPYGSIYNYDIKQYLMSDFPYVIEALQNEVYKNLKKNEGMSPIATTEGIGVSMDTETHYRWYDKEYDNECLFVESLHNDIDRMNKNRRITVDILKEAGFEDVTQEFEKQYYKEHEGIDDYITLRKWTVDTNPSKILKLDIDNRLTNSGRQWNLHIDNCDCCTIGSAELDNVWQFNLLMTINESKFRL